MTPKIALHIKAFMILALLLSAAGCRTVVEQALEKPTLSLRDLEGRGTEATISIPLLPGETEAGG